ncbi:uncharacterized protein LOC141903187 [Tubulanus polymorphus]|uniref:uncharacterized protein LOC141903187 n=1 Tax=Tubulanus polymorphus TaxID=672921 RepID=UPI003DA3D7C3
MSSDPEGEGHFMVGDTESTEDIKSVSMEESATNNNADAGPDRKQINIHETVHDEIHKHNVNDIVTTVEMQTHCDPAEKDDFGKNKIIEKSTLNTEEGEKCELVTNEMNGEIDENMIVNTTRSNDDCVITKIVEEANYKNGKVENRENDDISIIEDDSGLNTVAMKRDKYRLTDYEVQTDSDSESAEYDSDSSSDSSSSSVVVVAHGDRDHDNDGGRDDDEDRNSTPDPTEVRKQPVRTRGELLPEDLPAIEELHIELPDDVTMIQLGQVSGIVGILVIVQAHQNTPALDADSILFYENKKPIGQVFETFGPVIAPLYSIRFNSTDQIDDSGISIGTAVYCAPTLTQYTHYIFMNQLKQMKGSDASWENNNEPPPKFVDYSDDEQEKMAKRALKEARNPINSEAGNEGDASNQKSRRRPRKKHANQQNSANTQPGSEEYPQQSHQPVFHPGFRHPWQGTGANYHQQRPSRAPQHNWRQQAPPMRPQQPGLTRWPPHSPYNTNQRISQPPPPPPQTYSQQPYWMSPGPQMQPQTIYNQNCWPPRGPPPQHQSYCYPPRQGFSQPQFGIQPSYNYPPR